VIRSFIAFELPPAARELLANIQDGMKRAVSGIGWVKPTSIHLTLVFLGNIHEHQVVELGQVMAKSVVGSGSLELFFSETGAFPGIRSPRVIWVGLAGQTDKVSIIKKNLDELLQPMGFEPEQRSFKPHLTLGRVKERINPALLSKLIAETVIVEKEPFIVSNLVLYQSRLFPDGAQYTPLTTIALGQS
jgi:RNA 2',3'-cyclic 3'-phosphodiesterase